MKYKILLAAMFVMLLSIQNIKAAESEPNNDRSTANTLALNGNNSGGINSAGDVDWWKVTTTSDGKLNITLTPASSVYTWIYLYDNNGAILLNSGYSTTGFTVSKDGLAAGTYYIKVQAYYGNEVVNYTISNTLNVPTQANDAEPNNNRAQAKVLNLNKSVTGHVNYFYNNSKDTADWYKITPTSDGRIRLTMTSANGQNVWAYLYDTDGTTLIANGYTSGSSVVVNKDGLAAGTYYIRVNTYYDSEWAPYTLEDSLFVPTQANDVEPNNNKTQSTNLALNNTVTGHVNYYSNLAKDSSDWYKLTIPQDGMINLTINSHNGQNVWVYLFDKDGTTQLNAAYTSGSTSIKTDGLGAGTYYLRVNTYYTNEWAPYSLTNAFTPYTFANDAEPNDYFNQAKTIPANGTVTGHVNFYYDGVKNAEDRWKINYTGAGTMTLNFNMEAHKSDGSIRCTWVQVYKDTTTSPIYSNYFCGTPNPISLTGLAKGYLYIKVFTYYSSDFTAYSISPVFTQTKAKAKFVSADTSAACDTANSLTIKCSGSKAPYTVTLYKNGLAQGSAVTIKNTANYTFTGLSKGNYTVRVYGDGATSNAYGTFPAIEIMPKPVNARTTGITGVQARLNWNTLSCANYFSVQYRKASTATWTTVNTNGNTTFLIIKNLTASTKYYWRVAAADSANNVTGLSAYTDSVTFTTAAAFAGLQSSSEEDAISKSSLPNKATVLVYPNPASSFFRIQLSNPTDIQVAATLKDINGNIVWSNAKTTAAALSGKMVDVSSFAKGTYILQVTNADGKIATITKIVITR